MSFSCKRCGSTETYNTPQVRCKPCKDAYTSKRDADNRPAKLAQLRATNRSEFGKAAQRRYKARLRAEVVDAYGNVCVCCKEDEPLFLQVDHINGGGNAHRRAMPKGSGKFDLWLKNQGFPKDFQLLCANCNTGKWRNRGICPHKAVPRPVVRKDAGKVGG